MENKTTVLEILKQYLKENGYDGLYDGEHCHCHLCDLASCGCIYPEDCRAGYQHPDPSGDMEYIITGDPA
jgi:hypothetical protein